MTDLPLVRQSALPLYLYHGTDALPPWDSGSPFVGRVVVWSGAVRLGKQRMPRTDLHHLCETDIAWLPEADADLLPQIAPRVKAVLFGNLACELAMGAYGDDALDGEQDLDAIASRQVRFIHDAKDRVAAAGGRLAVAPVPSEILADLYTVGRMRDAIAWNNAVFVCFNGPSLWQAMDGDAEGAGQVYDLLHQYISMMAEAICGMEWLNGLAAGNDVRAKAHGFTAGLLGNSWRT